MVHPNGAVTGITDRIGDGFHGFGDGWRMTQGFTMASAADLLKKLMDNWEEALQVTIETGYWKDTVACDRIVAEYENQITAALQSGKFSGDSGQGAGELAEPHDDGGQLTTRPDGFRAPSNSTSGSRPMVDGSRMPSEGAGRGS
jgi:hypothetical protein